jgi:hypothetical protein
VIFIVLAVGTANFSSRRLSMEEYVPAANQKLSLLRTPTRIVDFHHATANLIVQTPKVNRSEIADELSLVLGVPCAILQTGEVLPCVSIAERMSNPPIQTGIRWTKGIAFKVRGRPCTVDLKPTPRAEFFRINGYAIGVFRKDQLTTDGVLDKTNTAGGWAAISGDISSVMGGIWTVRALVRIQGVLAKALKREPSAISRKLSR